MDFYENDNEFGVERLAHCVD